MSLAYPLLLVGGLLVAGALVAAAVSQPAQIRRSAALGVSVAGGRRRRPGLWFCWPGSSCSRSRRPVRRPPSRSGGVPAR